MAQTLRTRDRQIAVLLNPEESDYLQENADELGISRSAYLRMILLADMRKRTR